ncbi:unnamed protein product [Cylicostephanus goldi]|uniref:Guanylate kinase-like domain-containing protein n=1 Tax=Cylicostephanus goldi TaxID=71465 RepID=A0A3P6S140_CYLGO|nr:unnamed protein product [Cylicostephanus goldi]
MQRMIENGEFLEHASFGGNTYGTSKKAVKDVECTGKICVLDIELQGVLSIKKSNLNARFILIRPPSLEILVSELILSDLIFCEALELSLGMNAFFEPFFDYGYEKRLRDRGTEKEEDIEKRLKHAREDLKASEQNPDLFDLVIINDDLETAYKQFIAAIEDDLMSISSA